MKCIIRNVATMFIMSLMLCFSCVGAYADGEVEIITNGDLGTFNEDDVITIQFKVDDSVEYIGDVCIKKKYDFQEKYVQKAVYNSDTKMYEIAIKASKLCPAIWELNSFRMKIKGDMYEKVIFPNSITNLNFEFNIDNDTYDTVYPEIHSFLIDKNGKTLYPDDSITVEAKVTDNVGIANVTVNIDNKYFDLQYDVNSKKYIAVIPLKGIKIGTHQVRLNVKDVNGNKREFYSDNEKRYIVIDTPVYDNDAPVVNKVEISIDKQGQILVPGNEITAIIKIDAEDESGIADMYLEWCSPESFSYGLNNTKITRIDDNTFKLYGIVAQDAKPGDWYVRSVFVKDVCGNYMFYYIEYEKPYYFYVKVKNTSNLPEYTVEYIISNDEMQQETKIRRDVITLSDIPDKEGYQFKYWEFYIQEKGECYAKAGTDILVMKDLIFRAVYTNTEVPEAELYPSYEPILPPAVVPPTEDKPTEPETTPTNPEEEKPTEGDKEDVTDKEDTTDKDDTIDKDNTTDKDNSDKPSTEQPTEPETKPSTDKDNTTNKDEDKNEDKNDGKEDETTGGKDETDKEDNKDDNKEDDKEEDKNNNHGSSSGSSSSGISSQHQPTMAEQHVSGYEEWAASVSNSRYSPTKGSYYYDNNYFMESNYKQVLNDYKKKYSEFYGTDFASYEDYPITILEVVNWKLPNNAGRIAYNYKRGVVSSERGILLSTAFPFPSKWEKIGDRWTFTYTNNTHPTGQRATNREGRGCMVYDWEFIEGKWYAFDEMSILAVGWLYDEAEQSWFYLDESQGTATGWKEIMGKWYYFEPVSNTSKGRMLTNTWIGNCYVNENGVWIQ